MRAHGERTTTLRAWVGETEPAGAFSPARLRALAGVAAALDEARGAAAGLDERGALRTLHRAERAIDLLLDLPGSARWYAEVQVAVAETAAQAGQWSLAKAALLRALSVDPERRIAVGEGRPRLVAQSAVARRALRSGPRGTFRVQSGLRGAVLSVDDARVGPLPQTVDITVGAHILRVLAPGHLAWGAVVEVAEGARPPLRVVLTPSPRMAAAQVAERVAASGSLPRTLAALAEGSLPARVVAIGARGARAVVLDCDARGSCRGPVEVVGDRGEAPGPIPDDAPRLTERSLRRAGRFLSAPRWTGPRAEPHEAPLWERWEFWGVVALGAAAVVGLSFGLAQTSGRGDRVVDIVFPGDGA